MIMDEIMTYELVWIAIVLGIGIAAGPTVAIPAAVLWGISAGASLIALASVRAPQWVRMAFLLIAVVLFGVARHAATPAFPEWLLRRASSIDEATGTVISCPDIAEASVSFTLAPDHLPGYLLVYWSCDQPLQQVHRGDRVCVRGSARLPEPFDGFDYPAYLARQNIFATLFADDVVCLDDAAPFSLWNAGDRLRQRLLQRLRQVLPLDLAAMAQSLLFGDRSALPQEIEDAFSRTGLMHLLAVSGLHLGIFLAGAWWVLRRMGFRPRVAYPVVGCLVLLALTIVGPRVSLVRAGLLFAFLALGSVLADCGLILKRWIHPLNGLAAAAIAILLIRPGALYDAGFQLTMAATGSILIAFSPSGWGTRLSSRPLRKGISGTCGCWLRRMIVVSAAAQAGAAPVIAWHFEAFHPLSPLANLVAVPLAGISLWAGLLCLLVSATVAFPWAVVPLAFLLGVLKAIVTWLSQLPIIQLPVTPALGLWMGGCVGFVTLTAFYVSLSSRTSNSMSMDSESDDG